MSTVPIETASIAEPMHMRRPDWLEAAIEERYQNIAGEVQCYDYFGDRPRYIYFPLDDFANTEHMVYTDALLADLEGQKGAKLRVLDIGAGVGRFALHCQEEGHEAIAVSAHDFREESDIAKRLQDGTYVIGDANRLVDILELSEPFDLIVSQKTFMHLADPVGTLEQALNMLGASGVLAIGDFNLTNEANYHNIAGVPLNFDWLRGYLGSLGHIIDGGTVQWNEWPGDYARTDMIIRAPHQDAIDEVRLPVGYQKDSDGTKMRYARAEGESVSN